MLPTSCNKPASAYRIISIIFLLTSNSADRDRFLKRSVGTVEAPGLANGLTNKFERRRCLGHGVWGRVSPSPGVPLPRKNFDLGSQIGEFWCKLCAFCTVHLHVKLVLRSWERRSHCQNNFGNAVPRRSRWKRSMSAE